MSEELTPKMTTDEISILSYNLANTTKWIFNIPIGRLFQLENKSDQVLEFPLNCKSVQFPEFKIGTGKTSFLGYSFDISSRQNLTEKGLIIDFLISSNWLQYILLLKWFELEDYTRYTETRESLATVEIGSGVKPTIDDSKFKNPAESRRKSILFNTTVQLFPVIYIYWTILIEELLQ